MKILLIDDDINLCKVISYQLQKHGYEVITANRGEDGLNIFQKSIFDVVITDIQMPDISGMEVLKRIRKKNSEIIVILITAFGSVENAIAACRSGADDYITKPFGQEQLFFIIEKAIELRKLKRENIQLRSHLIKASQFESIIFQSTEMNKVLQMTTQVAQSDATVLITGESGTGKELIARAIHFNSERKDKPFVTINCPSIPQNLLESELFGHLKGAFTGAIKDRVGKFELADSGTIFLDEIGDLPEELQSKLLRVLQEQKIERLGDSVEKNVDVRIISATNRDLEELVVERKFREDLYFRLVVVPIQIPPLRDRKEDIPILLNHFLTKKNANRKIRIDAAALEILQEYRWPGNVRELENLVERILVFLQSDVIFLKDLPAHIKSAEHPDHLKSDDVYPSSLDEIEKKAILNALRNNKGNKSKAARVLKIPRHVLLYRMKKLGLEN